MRGVWLRTALLSSTIRALTTEYRFGGAEVVMAEAESLKLADLQLPIAD